MNSSCQTPRMESGATIRMRRTLLSPHSAPVMAMAVRLFPVPMRYISIRSAQPRLALMEDMGITCLSSPREGVVFARPNLQQTKLKASIWCR